MNAFDVELQRRLEEIAKADLNRQLRRIDSPQGPHIFIQGKQFLNFSSNDYLGLANHPALKEAALKAVRDFGAGSGASRLICGSLAPHHELEESLAGFKGAQAALTFSTGYATAVGTITSLVGKDDIVIIDKLVHASIVDAVHLSGAKLRVFAHNDLNSLEEILKWTREKREQDVANPSKPSSVLIVTESVFSMDGDVAPLREIVSLKNQYGAWLMLDEAHATGLYGENRRGVAEREGVGDQIEIQMGTLGKALGSSGGYICGSRRLIDFLVNRARSFVFSTGPVPAAAAAAKAAVSILNSAEGISRCQTLWQRVCKLTDALPCKSLAASPIVPILIGDESTAVTVASELRDAGVFIPAIRYPTVARGKARLRLTLSASHSDADVDELVGILEKLKIVELTPHAS